jgi:hypothetical protein
LDHFEENIFPAIKGEKDEEVFFILDISFFLALFIYTWAGFAYRFINQTIPPGVEFGKYP